MTQKTKRLTTKNENSDSTYYFVILNEFSKKYLTDYCFLIQGVSKIEFNQKMFIFRHIVLETFSN